MRVSDTPEWTVAEAAQLATLTRQGGDGRPSYAKFLRRQVARVSARKMAQTLGIHPETLRCWEDGKYLPRGVNAANYLRLLQELEVYYEVSLWSGTKVRNRGKTHVTPAGGSQ